MRNALWTSEVVITEGGQGPPPWRKDRITQTSSHIEPSGFSKAEGERPLFGKPSQWKMQLSGNKISSSWTAPICALAMPEEIHISNDFVFLETLFFQSSLATGDVEALHQLLLLFLGCHHNTTWLCMISPKECFPSGQPHFIWNETASILWNHISKSFNLISDHDSACIRNCKCFQVGWWNRFRIKENIASSSKQLSLESILNNIWV